MRRLLTALRARLATQTLTATSFCEGCGEVCTSVCRHEAIRARSQLRVQEIGLYRH